MYDLVSRALLFLGSRRHFESDMRIEWEVLRGCTESEAQVLRSRIFGAGTRLFEDEKSARVILWRDSSAWCPFCTMAQLLLEEMGLSYKVKTIPLKGYMKAGQEKDPEYVKMVPDGVVPGLQHWDEKKECWEKAYRNVYAIFSDLCTRYPEKYPMGEKSIHEKVCGPQGLVGQFERAPYRSQPESAAQVLKELDQLIEKSGGPFLCGTQISAADLQILPLLERYEAYVLYYYGRARLEKIAPFDRLSSLLAAARSQSKAVADLCSDQHTLIRILLSYDPDAEIPKNTDADAIIKPRRDFSPQDARLAAAKLIRNHRAVANFAAGLANKESPGLALTEAVDYGLLQVATALLHDGRPTPKFTIETSSFSGPSFSYEIVANALSMLSLNVGVPRDFFYGGPADALRAYCSDFAQALVSSCSPPEDKNDRILSV